MSYVFKGSVYQVMYIYLLKSLGYVFLVISSGSRFCQPSLYPVRQNVINASSEANAGHVRFLIG